MRSFRCPCHGCGSLFTTSLSLRGHLTSHLRAHTCTSCGTPVESVDALLYHFGVCSRNRRASKRHLSESSDERRDPSHEQVDPAPMVNAFQQAEMGEQVWDDVLDGDDLESVPLLPLDPEHGLDEDMLDLLCADIWRKDGLSVLERVVAVSDLKKDFNSWRSSNGFVDCLDDCALKEDKICESLFQNVILPHRLGAGPVARIHSWLRDVVGPRLSPLDRETIPEALSEFRAFGEARSDIMVEVVLCSHPLVTMVVLPLMLTGREVFTAPDTQFTDSPPRMETNPSTGSQEPAIRSWCDAGKFKWICNAELLLGVLCVFWSFFVDSTRLTRFGNRKGHAILACPLNNSRGDFDLVGFIPHVSNEHGREAGLSAAQTRILRALIIQRALFVSWLYGGMIGEERPYVVRNQNGGYALGRHVLGNMRLDGEAICYCSSRVIVTSSRHAPKCACFRHEIRSDQLSEVIRNPSAEHSPYKHNAAYKAKFQSIVRNFWDSKIPKEQSKRACQELGFLPIEPAYFDVPLFDGASDLCGDYHHQGPHGLGMFLLDHLSEALQQAFPLEVAHACLKSHHIPCNYAVDELELYVGDRVIVALQPPHGVHVRAGMSWVTADNASGFVPTNFLSVTRAHDHNFKESLREIDVGVRCCGSFYVRSFDPVDFASFVLAEETKQENKSSFFNRATTVEIVLLFMPFVLAFVLRDRPRFRWITNSFLCYNKMYWNWRRTVFFVSDRVVLDEQRVAFKFLLCKHWTEFSKTRFNFMKMEQIDHMVADLIWHGPVRYTGTGSGDHAHKVTAKKPFQLSNKTKNESSLHKQMACIGPVPTFLTEAKDTVRERVIGLTGTGCMSFINSIVRNLLQALHNDDVDWENEATNGPLFATVQLWKKIMSSCGIDCDFDSFNLWRVSVHHSFTLCKGVEIFGSSSFHDRARHDFVTLVNQSISRVVAIVNLEIPSIGWRSFALCEQMINVHNIDLEYLGFPILVSTVDWDWVSLVDIVKPLSVLCHPSDPTLFFIIHDKHEERLWI